MTAFEVIYQAAIERHGEEALKARLPIANDDTTLCQFPDDRYLSQMSLRIFSAGLKHDMVKTKWPAFEQAFHGFDPAKVGFMTDDDLDQLLGDTRLIRHGGKLRATIHNGAAMQDIISSHGSFGAFLAEWPGTNTIGLLEDLGKRFKHLGGNSAAYFLRMVGKDTFTMSKDVERGLAHWQGLENAGKSKTSRNQMQSIFNNWASETGRPHCQLSMILALST